ncbi:hypothetical protein EDC26_11249 [Paralcaligenes ureilyticus]|uniref:Uncharacterized protein n=1 Tax=Paralcaligenes ureilyticus TaxID=627131 RepID=A0A4R3M065_9BURK|nr:hypothetical protein EDC26_11249 [Paralcaligenes ureilyticus]
MVDLQSVSTSWRTSMVARTSLLMASLFLLLATLIVVGPARGSNQFNVRISIVSQCGPQPGPMFGPGSQFNIACLSSGTMFHAQQFSVAPSFAPSSGSGSGSTRTAEGTSSGQSVSYGNGTGGAGFNAPSVDLPSPPLPSDSAKDVEKVVYVVF